MKQQQHPQQQRNAVTVNIPQEVNQSRSGSSIDIPIQQASLVCGDRSTQVGQVRYSSAVAAMLSNSEFEKSLKRLREAVSDSSDGIDMLRRAVGGLIALQLLGLILVLTGTRASGFVVVIFYAVMVAIAILAYKLAEKRFQGLALAAERLRNTVDELNAEQRNKAVWHLEENTMYYYLFCIAIPGWQRSIFSLRVQSSKSRT